MQRTRFDEYGTVADEPGTSSNPDTVPSGHRAATEE